MFFNSIKEINTLRKEINRLRKEINYSVKNVKYLLKSYYWDVLKTSVFWVVSFWGAPTHAGIIEFLNLSKGKLWCVRARERKKCAFSVPFILFEGIFLKNLCFVSMYSVLNILSEYLYSYLSKNITSYTLAACF